MELGHYDDNEDEKRRKSELLSDAADIVANNWGVFARFGHFAVKFGAALLLGIIISLKLIFSELIDLGASLIKAVIWLLKEMASPLRSRFDLNKKLQKQVRKAKKENKSEYNKALLNFWGS